MTEESTINRCVCGYSGELLQFEIYYWVECTRKECWHGPVVPRRDKAIKAWNKTMQRSNDV